MTSTSHPRRTWFAILSLLAALGCSQGDATGGDDDSGLSDELSKAFETLDLDLGSTSEVHEARAGANGKHMQTAEIASDFDKVALADGQTLAVGEKEACEVSMIFVLPETESGNTGALDSKEIGWVIGVNIGGIKYCYERQLIQNQNLAGKIVVEFTIAETGRVESARVIESTMNANVVEQCIVEKMKRLKFPRPKGGKVTVSYPFVFEKSYTF